MNPQDIIINRDELIVKLSNRFIIQMYEGRTWIYEGIITPEMISESNEGAIIIIDISQELIHIGDNIWQKLITKQ